MEFSLRVPDILGINGHVWLLNDNDEATAYIVEGTKRAAVIDTMLGFVDLHAVAENLTDKPLVCINTHGHLDHIGGNWSFEKAYLNALDLPLAAAALQNPMVQEVIAKGNLHFPDYVDISDGMCFDLGGVTLEAYHLPGHTPGEIVLLDQKDRILFSGDGILEQLWLQLPESLPVSVQIQSMRRIACLRSKFDMILGGHNRLPYEAGLFDTLLSALQNLEAGKTAGDSTYQWFGGTALSHSYGKEPRRIVYNCI